MSLKIGIIKMYNVKTMRRRMLSIEEIQKQLRELTEEMENLKDNTVDDIVDYTVLSANGAV